MGVCTNRIISSVIKEWQEPSLPEFGDGRAWSLFNAFTEILKGKTSAMGWSLVRTAPPVRWAASEAAFCLLGFSGMDPTGVELLDVAIH